jgi:hypothetical protein
MGRAFLGAKTPRQRDIRGPAAINRLLRQRHVDRDEIRQTTVQRFFDTAKSKVRALPFAAVKAARLRKCLTVGGGRAQPPPTVFHFDQGIAAGVALGPGRINAEHGGHRVLRHLVGRPLRLDVRRHGFLD